LWVTFRFSDNAAVPGHRTFVVVASTAIFGRLRRRRGRVHAIKLADPLWRSLAAKFFVRPKRVRSSGDKAIEEALF
jgi:hypothetical protein